MDGRVVAGPSAPGNVVVDLDGVVYLAGTPVPGAAAALDAVADAGYRILFATNNSSTAPADVAEKIARVVGYPADPASVVTSAMAAASWASAADSPAFVLGEAGLEATLHAAGIATTGDPDDARAVFVGLDRGLSYERLRAATTAVMRGARFIATNPDVTFPTPGGLWPGGGAIAAAVAAAAGRRPELAGKPHAPMRRVVEERLGPGPTWMIGDRPETDVAFGRAAGWRTVLVLSGVTTAAAEIPTELRPDHVLDSIASLPGLLAGRE